MTNKELKEKLLIHRGHEVTIVTYNNTSLDIVNVSLECLTCNEVIVDYEVTKKDTENPKIYG